MDQNKEDEKPGSPKDRWDKTKIAGHLLLTLASLIATSGITLASHFFAASIKEKETRAQMVELAVGVLKEKPAANDSEAQALRDWAIDVISCYSGIPISPEARQALRTEALPSGQLDISAVPADATLSIDGIVQDRGQAVIPLSPGKHRVRIERKGVVREFEVEAQSATAILTRDLLRM